MRWRRFPVRFRVRWLMAVVAALLMAVWAAWFDPVRRWQRAVTDDEDGAGRWQALSAMAAGSASVDTATALATLTRALRSPSYRVRETAVAGLGRLGPAARPAVPALIELLGDADPLVRGRTAAELIAVLPPGDSGRRQAVSALRQLLGDRSREVRQRAAFTLAEFGDGRAALSVLIEALRRPDYLAQADALWALGHIGPSAASEALPEVKALEARATTAISPDLSRYLVVYAARTRYLLGDRPAGLAALRSLANGADPDLAREARLVLSARLPADAQDELGPAPDTPQIVDRGTSSGGHARKPSAYPSKPLVERMVGPVTHEDRGLPQTLVAFTGRANIGRTGP